MAALLYVVTIVLGLVAMLYNPVKQRLVTFGAFRSQINNIHGHEYKQILDTLQCEDLHHHQPSGLLFTACQTDAAAQRKKWFPPLAHFDATGVGQGTIVVIDTKTLKAKHLKLRGFKGPFVTHGIDIYNAPADPTQVTIFAINHLPHPKAGDPTNAQHAQSQIEVFRYTIGEDHVSYVRSVADPLIATPNDIYATSASSFYVTNDHYYRDGPMRLLEDLGTRFMAGWSTTIHVSFTDVRTSDPSTGVKAMTALKGLHNNNGLGHSSAEEPEIVAIGDASGGEITLAKRNLTPRPNVPEDLKLQVLEHIQLDSCVDNPSYYTDPYATAAHNASGFVVAGLAQGMKLQDQIKENEDIPSIVWHITRGEDGAWKKKIIFQDDGDMTGAAATAVLVAVDPAETEGMKKAWLFVTGFLSEAVTVNLIDV